MCSPVSFSFLQTAEDNDSSKNDETNAKIKHSLFSFLFKVSLKIFQ